MEQTVTPPAALLNEKQAETYLGLKPGTLAAARHHGRPCPPAIRIGERALRYRLADIESWLSERVVTNKN